MSLAAVLCLEGLGGDGVAAIGGRSVALRRVGGVAVLLRQILVARQGGATGIWIVPGPHESEVRALLDGEKRLRDIPIEITSGPTDEALPKALSHAANHERIMLASGDVLFGKDIGKRIKEMELGSGATQLVPGVGLFALPPGAVAIDFRQEVDAHSSTLELIDRHEFVFRIQAKPDLRRAKVLVFKTLTKQTSGWISKNINSKISLPLSWFLCELPVTPNMMTVFTTLVGMSSGWFLAGGEFTGVLIAGIAFQMAAALDRVDGELARGKFMASKMGAWIDTVGDNLAYLCFVIGLIIGTYERTGDDIVLGAGFGMLALFVAVVGWMMWYLVKNTSSGSLTDVRRDVDRELAGKKKPGFYRFLDTFHFVGKRDFFSLAVCLICAANLLTPLFWMTVSILLLAGVYYAMGTFLKARARRAAA